MTARPPVYADGSKIRKARVERRHKQAKPHDGGRKETVHLAKHGLKQG